MCHLYWLSSDGLERNRKCAGQEHWKICEIHLNGRWSLLQGNAHCRSRRTDRFGSWHAVGRRVRKRLRVFLGNMHRISDRNQLGLCIQGEVDALT